MNRKVSDDASTRDVVWAAAERIGKASSTQEISRICDYLINKHWFQTAGDLRVARENAQEWHALDVPGRLKIAIQDVLDALADPSPSNAPAPPSAGEVSEVIIEGLKEVESRDVPHQESACGGIDAGNYVESASYANTYSYGYYATAEGPTREHPAAEQEEEAAAAHVAAWEAYYAANGYYTYPDGAAEVVSWAQGAGIATDGYESTEIVEAQEVVVEDVIVAEPFRDDESQDSGNHLPVKTTWSCGQCTYDNSADASFCEMCFGHISLSADAPNVTAQIPHSDPQNASDVEIQTPSSQSSELARSPILPPPAPAATVPLEPPLFVSIPCPSPALSPVYSPSAPDFEEALPDEIEQTSSGMSGSDWNIGARQLSPPDGSPSVQEPPPAPSPPKVDYCALAFKRIPSFRGDDGATKASEERTPTEFMF